MKLTGEHGVAFELNIDCYQFREVTDYWDSNWLMVRGDVEHPRGGWTFRDPCLTTFELEQLATWFDEVDMGTAAADNGHFTEPNLSFDYVVASEPEIRVTFAHESAPPWLVKQDQRANGAVITLPLRLNSPRETARSLRSLLSNYPKRGTPELTE